MPRTSGSWTGADKYLDSDGNRVNVGNFDAKGLNVNNNWDDNRNDNLGLSSARQSSPDIDLKTYAKYILREGTNEEKRELMGCFKSRIKVLKGVVTIEE